MLRFAFQLFAATTLVAAASAQSPTVAPERAEYTFRTPPLNSMGVKTLADLRGRPVLIEFWGTR